ncbi:hypothetical protein H0W91_00560 [Patescibacteria group bacterium]|nr:hypothetical protein [Patescibacteria group bacterium]
MIKIDKKIITGLSLLFFTLPVFAFAQANLFLSPSTGSYKVGESFSVLVNLNSGGQSVNAGTGQISFDNARLQVLSLGYSQSIFTLWTDNPSYSNPAGTIYFSGGVPSPGFIGASGGILRITFRAKAIGQAPVNFISGSILANDGQGTNIADGLRGSLYYIEPADSTVPSTVKPPETSPVIDQSKPLEVPTITDWPKKVEAGKTLTIGGLGIPLTKISIIIEKGTEGSVNEYTFSGSDGKFRFTYDKQVESGYYRIWARNVSESGSASGLSDPITVEVTSSSFIRLGGLILNYMTIIITLLSLLLLLLLLLIILWILYRRSKKKKGHEISEAEEMLHTSFDKLRDGLSTYVTYLVSAKTAAGVKRREQKTKDDLKEELDNIEGKIKKEIKDIK